MNRKHLAYVSIFIASFLITPKYGLSQSCPQNAAHPGYHTITQTTSTETITREYIIQLPSNYDENTSTPLVINMHGFGNCAADFYDDIGGFYEFNILADNENFIVAYPQGAYRTEKDDHYWEPGDNGVEDIYENDVYFIDQLIAKISADFNVDPDRIYAAGYSNGGMMAYSLACNRSNLFAAIGIMSGTMLDDDCILDSPVLVIVFHGIADDILPYDGGAWYQSTDEIIDYWLGLNNIPSSSQQTASLNDGKVVRDAYFGGDDNTCVALYTINEEWDKEGGHVWFSDQIEGVTPNKIMWDFFSIGCSSISSNTEFSDSNFNVYPNPLSSIITLDSKFSIGTPFHIHNSSGKVVFSGKVHSNNFQFDLSSLTPSVYVLQIGSQVKKLIKTN